MVMMDAGEPQGRKVVIRPFLNVSLAVANRSSFEESKGWVDFGEDCFTFLHAWTVLVVFVSASDFVIVQLCAELWRPEGLSAPKLADWTSLCNSLICMDAAP